MRPSAAGHLRASARFGRRLSKSCRRGYLAVVLVVVEEDEVEEVLEEVEDDVEDDVELDEDEVGEDGTPTVIVIVLPCSNFSFGSGLCRIT